MLDKVQKIINDSNLDIVVFSDPVHLLWFAGFSGSTGVLLVSDSGAVLGVDFRYHEIAEDLKVENLDVYCAPTGNLLKNTLDYFFKKKVERVGYLASRNSQNQKESLQKVLNAELVAIDHEINFARSQKNKSEIVGLVESSKLNADLFNHIREMVKPGISERDLAAEIISYAVKKGASKMAFDPIVASGKNASRPHASFTDKILEPGEPLTLDLGVCLDGWSSDMTRTWVVPGKKPTEGLLKIFDIVNSAKKEAESHLAVGASGHDLDASARDVIKKFGYGDFFGHSLGHGIGREVHEEPRLAQNSKDIMLDGMAVTIEPGIYIKDKHGVRIEDSYLIVDKNVINLGIDVFSDFF